MGRVHQSLNLGLQTGELIRRQGKWVADKGNGLQTGEMGCRQGKWFADRGNGLGQGLPLTAQ